MLRLKEGSVSLRVRLLRGGQAVSGKEVMISFVGDYPADRGWIEESTDCDGVAEFDAEPGTAKVIIDGTSYGEYYLDDGGEVTIDLR